MRFAAIFTVLIFLVPTPTLALTRPPLSTKLCPPGASSEAPQKISKFLDEKLPEADAQKFLNTAIYCPNACYNLEATLTLKGSLFETPGTQVDIVATHVCKYKDKLPDDPIQGEKRGCLKGYVEPTIFLKTKDVYSVTKQFKIADQSIAKPRCDENALSLSVEKFFNGLKAAKENGAAGQTTMEQALADLRTQSDPRPDAAKPPQVTLAAIPPEESQTIDPAKSDSTALAQILQDKYDVPTDQAKSLVESNAEKIKAMIEKSMNNDKEGAAAIARELKLNEDVLNNIAKMEPAKQFTPEEAQAVYQQQQLQRQTTFAEKSPIEKAKQAIANIESSGGRYDLLGPVNPRTGDRPYGKYQVMGANVGPWTREALGYRMTPEEFRADPQAQEKVFEYKFQQYADRHGGYENAARVWFGGTGALRNPGARDSLGTTVSNYAQRFSQYYQSGEVIGSGSHTGRPYTPAFTGFTGGTNQILALGRSPFSGASLFNFDRYEYDSSSDYGYPSYSSGAGSGSGGSIFSQLMSYIAPRPAVPIPRQVYYPTRQSQGVVTIIAQPQQAFVGNSIVVSWSSVGMRPDAPCTTLMFTKNATTTIGSSNEGSRVVTAGSAGIIRFVSYCNALSGGAISNATAVAVQ